MSKLEKKLHSIIHSDNCCVVRPIIRVSALVYCLFEADY